jgi:hypothetical protein
LVKKAKPFTLKKGIVYKVGQGNKMCKCLTTLEAQIVLKELHEGVEGGHFVVDVTGKENFGCNILVANYI